MSRRYALQGTRSRDLLTYGGRVIVHSNRAELEFLTAGDVRVIECPRSIPPEQCLELRFHPDFAHHRFPLSREDYL